jgi:HPt (histidine-containing phosphotransfer) domain-containing protein
MAIIDWEQFNENFQYYDKETIGLVIENFLEESEERLCKMEKNINDLDFANLSFNAHSFKSVVGNFMAPKPYEVCRKLEELANQKSEMSIQTVFSELKTLTAGLISELMDYQKSNN